MEYFLENPLLGFGMALTVALLVAFHPRPVRWVLRQRWKVSLRRLRNFYWRTWLARWRRRKATHLGKDYASEFQSAAFLAGVFAAIFALLASIANNRIATQARFDDRMVQLDQFYRSYPELHRLWVELSTNKATNPVVLAQYKVELLAKTNPEPWSVISVHSNSADSASTNFVVPFTNVLDLSEKLYSVENTNCTAGRFATIHYALDYFENVIGIVESAWAAESQGLLDKEEMDGWFQYLHKFADHPLFLCAYENLQTNRFLDTNFMKEVSSQLRTNSKKTNSIHVLYPQILSH